MTTTDIKFGVAITVATVCYIGLMYLVAYILYKLMKVDEDIKRFTDSMAGKTEGPEVRVSRELEAKRLQHPSMQKSINRPVSLQPVRSDVPNVDWEN